MRQQRRACPGRHSDQQHRVRGAIGDLVVHKAEGPRGTRVAGDHAVQRVACQAQHQEHR